MANINLQCAICSGSFDSNVTSKSGKPCGLNKDGICVDCEKLYPGAKTKLEAMQLSRPELKLNEEITEEVVRRIAKEEIHKYMSKVTEPSKK